MTKDRIELEFSFSTTPSILFYRLSTPMGLSEWFADQVTQDDDIFTFTWDRVEQKAEVVSKKENRYIRFRWLDKEYQSNPDSFFEFRITAQELTRETVLHITEQHPIDSIEDAESLWEYQIGELKRNLGV